MKRRPSVLGIAALLFAVQGCGDPSDAATTGSSEIGRQRARIVNGVVDPNHRYVVSLNGCTGTVISKYTVLTAGHCYGSISSVGFGPKSSGAMTIQVASKVRDPLYKTICDQDATYDLAVVKLASPSPVQPAPLLRATLDNTSKYIGPSWVWVGYGLTMQGGTSGTKRATTFPVDLIGPATGRGSLCEIPDTLIYANVTAHGRNACNGDSGGPSFWVQGGVEYLAGVVSSGDNACTLDDTQQRSDQPHIDRFIQQQIDLNEGTDPCRSNGVCDETCNANGQLGDPDCAANHCTADGICAEACVAPRDPDCLPLDSPNCEDNGVCDLTCSTDPDCVRDCGREGNCIPNCPTPDPDCAAQDGGTPSDGGSVDGGADASTDAGRDGAVADTTIPPPIDATTPDAATPDAATPTPDAATRDAANDATARDTAVRDTVSADTATVDAVADATARDTAAPEDATTMPDGATTGTGGAGGSGSGTGGGETPEESGCSCRMGAAHAPQGARAYWLGLGFLASALRRSRRRSSRR